MSNDTVRRTSDNNVIVEQIILSAVRLEENLTNGLEATKPVQNLICDKAVILWNSPSLGTNSDTGY